MKKGDITTLRSERPEAKPNEGSWTKENNPHVNGTIAARGHIKPAIILRRKLFEYTEETVLQLVDLMRNAKNEAVRLRACEVIIERVFGRAPQSVTVEDARSDLGRIDSSTLRQIQSLIVGAVVAADSGGNSNGVVSAPPGGLVQVGGPELPDADTPAETHPEVGGGGVREVQAAGGVDAAEAREKPDGVG